MGSPMDEQNRSDNEGPVSVTLTPGFWIGKYEATQEEWLSLMGTTLAQQRDKAHWRGEIAGAGSRQPMYFVSHGDATEFCTKLTDTERRTGRLPIGEVYRLPSEAEWEYACRAGTTTATSFGNSLSGLEANFNKDDPSKRVRRGTTVEVGSLNRPNAWGLHDMYGNVWELCADWYIPKLPGGRDPVVLQATGASDRVNRGGGWVYFPRDCRSALRANVTPDNRSHNLGFRIVLGPPYHQSSAKNPTAFGTATKDASAPSIPKLARFTLWKAVLDKEDFLTWSSDEIATVRRSFPKGIEPLGYVQNASSPDTKALLRFINPKTAIHTFSLTTPTGSEWRNEGNTCWGPATAGKGTVAVHRFLHKKMVARSMR